MKVFIILGAINALLAVALGAFGAHGLEGKIPDKYYTYDIARLCATPANIYRGFSLQAHARRKRPAPRPIKR